MKASLVSATSLAALLAFDIGSAQAGGVFSLGGTTGVVCTNTATTAGCTLTFYALPGQTSIGETVTMTATVAGGISGSQQFTAAPTGFAGGGNSSNTALPKNSTFTSTPAYTYTGAASAGSTGLSQTANATVSSGAASSNAAEVAPFTFVGNTVAPIESVTGGNAGYVLVSPTGTSSATTTVTVANKGAANKIGTAAADSLNGSITAFSAGGFFTGKATGTTITALHDSNASGGATTSSFAYTFAPTLRGAASNTATLSFSNGNNSGTNTAQTVTTTLTGTGVAPTESLASGANIGYVLVSPTGSSTGTSTVTLSNVGNGNLAGTGGAFNLSGSITGTNSGFSTTAVPSTVSLQDSNAGSGSTTATFNYTFAPTIQGATGNSTLTGSFSNGFGTNNVGGSQSVTLTATGVAPVNSVTVTNAAGAGGSANTGNLGYLLVGNGSATGTVGLLDNGNGNLLGTAPADNLNGSVTALTGAGYTPATTAASVSLHDSNASGGATTSAFNYTFAPAVRGFATTVVTASFSNGSQNLTNNSQTVTATISGSGVAPTATIVAGNNGYVLVSQSATASVTVQNVGNGNLAGTGGLFNLNGSITGTSGGGFTSSGTPTTVSLQDSNAGTGATTATFNYTFTPTIRGSATSSVTGSFSNGFGNANTGGSITTTLNATGVAPVESTSSGNLSNPAAAGSAPYVLVNSGQTAAATVSITNVGDGNLAGTGTPYNLNGSVSIVGSGFSGATSVSLNDSHYVGAGPTTNTTYTYVFQPTVTGASTGVGSAAFSNGSTNNQNQAQTQNFTYTGTGVAPVASLGNGATNYVLAGSSSAVAVTVTNTGNGNLSGLGTVSNLQGTILGTTSSGLFTGSDTTLGGGSGLQDSGTQSVSYVFSPTSIGTFSANVTGSFSNGTTNTNAGGNLTGTLSGTGVAPISSVAVSTSGGPGSSVTGSPGPGQPGAGAQANVGYVLVQGPTAAATVTVVNTGNGDLAGNDVSSGGSLQSNLHGTQGSPSSSVFVGGGGSLSLQDSNATTGAGFTSNGTTTATFTYNFAPTIISSSSATVVTTFTNSQGSGGQYATSTYTTTLVGSGVAPVNSVTLANAAGVGGSANTGNLGYVLVASQTATATIGVNNVGNGNLAGTGGVYNLNGSITSLTGSGYNTSGTTSVSLQDSNGPGGATTATYAYTFAPALRGTSTTIVTASFSNGSTDTTNNSQALTYTLTGTGVAPTATITAPGSSGYVLVQQSTTSTVTVANIGDGNLAGTGGAFNLNGSITTLNGAGFTNSGTPGTVSLLDSNAGAGPTTGSYNYTFAPTTRGSSTAVLTGSFSNGVGDDNTGGSSSVTLTGTGVAPINSVTLTNGNLGYLLVGSQTATANVTLSNVGDGNLAGTGGIYNLNGSVSALVGSGYTPPVVSPPTVSLLDSNAGSGPTTSSYNYTFAPTVRGTASTVVTSSFSNGSSDGLNNGQTVLSTITGVGVAPVATLSASNNGYVLVQSSNTATVTVANVGDGNLAGTGGAFNLNGSITTLNGTGFTNGATPPDTVSLLDSNALGGPTTSSYNYTFAPTARGSSSTVVTGTFSNGIGNGNATGSLAVTLTGTGVAPINTVTASSGNLGYLLVNKQSSTANVTIANIGDGNLAGTGGAYNLNGSITTLNGSGFSNGATPPDTVSLLDSNASGGATTSSYNYTFAPTVRGTSSTVVTSSFSNGSNDGFNNGQTVNNTFTGTGVAPVNSVVGSKTIARFNSYAPMTATGTGTATVTVYNFGDGNLAGADSPTLQTNLHGTVTGLSGSGFSQSGGSNTVNLVDPTTSATLNSSTLTYTYAPLSRGVSTSTVALSFSNGSSDSLNMPQSVSATITGTGVGPIYRSTLVGYGIDTPTPNTGSATIGFGNVTYSTHKTLLLNIANIESVLGATVDDTNLTLLFDGLSGPDAGDFMVSLTPGTELTESGGNINVPITVYAPSYSASLSAQLVFTTDESAAYQESGDTFTYNLSALSVASSAPEPASLAVLGVGLAGIGFARRRKRK